MFFKNFDKDISPSTSSSWIKQTVILSYQPVTGSLNTFSQFYLKDVAWADLELYHFRLVMAAEQIYHWTFGLVRFHVLYFII